MIFIRSKLKAQRIALGYTQDDIARKAGIHKSYYSKIEIGQRTPALDLWVKIGNALDIPDEQLIYYIKDGMEKGA